MRHLDLFSGIGGFALAAMEVWGDDYECVGFCDIEPYAQQLLKIRFPGVPIYENIKTLTAERLIADTDKRGRVHGRPEIKPTKGHNETLGELEPGIDTPGVSADTDTTGQPDRVKERGRAETQDGTRQPGAFRCDLLTGGFPCQPFSMAGKRRGTEDDRYLWPEMLRVIKEVKPTWIIGENVAGILTMGGADEPGVESETDNGEEGNGVTGADGVVWGIINDLENLGYAVQTFVIPACAVGAPHRRDRIWIVANTRHGNGTGYEKQREYEQTNKEQTTAKSKRPVERNESGITADTDGNGACGCSEKSRVERTQSTFQEQSGDRWAGQDTRYNWGLSWPVAATELCGISNGLPAELDGFKLSKAGHRVARLKGLGNAIVPQVVREIMYAIKETDK